MPPWHARGLSMNLAGRTSLLHSRPQASPILKGRSWLLNRKRKDYSASKHRTRFGKSSIEAGEVAVVPAEDLEGVGSAAEVLEVAGSVVEDSDRAVLEADPVAVVSFNRDLSRFAQAAS